MKTQLFIVAIFSILITGWFMNIYKLCKSDFESPYKNEIIRTVGVFFAPIGSIAGFIDIKDGN